jgi:hypothetical protein
LDVIREKMKKFWLAYQEPTYDEEISKKEITKVTHLLKDKLNS